MVIHSDGAGLGPGEEGPFVHPGTPIHGWGGGIHAREVLASAWHSRHCGWTRIPSVPITASRNTRISRESGSTLTVGTKLQLGYQHRSLGQDRFQDAPTSLDLGRNSRFEVEGFAALGPGVGIAVSEDAMFSIGDGSYITADSTILCTREVRIGRDCALAWGLMIMDTDFHEIVVPGQAWRDRAPVIIGDHVWIGAGVTVLMGVTIGEGAVVGAGSTVTKSVPPHTLVRGNPAVVVRDDVRWRA